MCMKILKISLFFFISLLIQSCYSRYGDSFFIRNYSGKEIDIQYKYFEKDDLIDSDTCFYKPRNFVFASNSLISKKQIKQYPYKAEGYFDTLSVLKIDSLKYQFRLGKEMSARILPVHLGESIELIILNGKDTLSFKDNSLIETQRSFYYEELFFHSFRIMRDNYSVLDVK